MKYSACIKRIVAFAAALLLITSYQNCGGDVKFEDITEVVKPLICDPLSPDGVITDCTKLTNGLVGEIRYFLDKDPATTIPEFVYDILDNAIPFPSGINDVEQFYSTGYLLNAKLILSSINKPSIRFSEGFKDAAGVVVADEQGNGLFEAFSFKLQSYLLLRDSQEEGLYEFGLLADDGAILQMDTDGDKNLEMIVDNNGTHSTRLACGSKAVDLRHGQPIPMQVKYYQGPRSHIALVMVMRKIATVDDLKTDSLCGFTDVAKWFGDTSKADYVPDYVNTKFGELAGRGWFIPTPDMFILPK